MTDTEPSTERRTRTKKRGGLFVTDAELIERLQVPAATARAALRALDADRRSGFPRKQKLWGDRRYWPAVEKYFDAIGSLNPQEGRRSA